MTYLKIQVHITCTARLLYKIGHVTSKLLSFTCLEINSLLLQQESCGQEPGTLKNCVMKKLWYLWN